KRNWCQIGVKTEKITISKEIRYCKPLILKGLQKKSQKISTHLLTVLTTSVIVRLEQRKKRKFTSTLFLFGANVSTQIDKEEADYEY
ncbi:MAG: hypothetical protein UCN58_09675, partial [Fusicatenibacter saccharivorans]|nr:hypothetical protein [Fusicatenibacter saccharivorans]